MSDSLRDQLLKTGLVKEQDLRRTQTEKRRAKSQQKTRKKAQRAPEQSQAAQAADQALAQKRARDRTLNARREAEKRREADEKAARELVLQHEISRRRRDDDVAFHFTRDGRIKHLYVTPAQRDELAAGRLAIARTRGQFRLLPREIAERVQAKAPFLVIYAGGPESERDETEGGEYPPVPDDLMW